MSLLATSTAEFTRLPGPVSIFCLMPARLSIYVPANHECYGHDVSEHPEALRTEGRKRGVDVLDGDDLVFDGVGFSARL